MRRLFLLSLLAAAGFGVAINVTAQAAACNDTATSANVVSKAASAPSGSTLCLSAGGYGTQSFTSKRSSTVTLRPADGATVTMRLDINGGAGYRFEGFNGSSAITGAHIWNGARNLSVTDTRWTGGPYIETPANVSNAGIILENSTFLGLGMATYEGRISVRGYNNTSPVGVTIRNNQIGSGGCSDGVQIVGNAYGVEVRGNKFDGIKQGSCGPHVDSIQLYGSRSTQIVGNLFQNSDTHIMAPDGGNNEVITDNVFVGAGYVPTVQLGSHNGTTLSHNTVKNADLHMDSKTGGTASRNAIIKDNVLVNGRINTTSGSGCSACTVTNNLTSGAVFVGGTSPTTYAGWALAAGSPGKGDATDGGDRGIRVSGGTVPTPTPTPTPTATATPTATPTPPSDTPARAVWTPPSNVRTGVPVTLDGTRSTGDAPLTCTWSFENQSGSTIWETATGCSLSKTFANADTKYVKLTVRDVDGDTNSNRQSFAVTRG